MQNFLNKIKAQTRIRTRIKNLLFQSKGFFLKSKNRIRSRIKLALSQDIKEDIIKIETSFPQAYPHGFTNIEINYLFEIIPTLVSYRPYKMTRDGDFINKKYTGTSEKDFITDKTGYLKFYKNSIGPKNESKIKFLSHNCKLRANLAFTHFLDQTYFLCPLFNKFKIPFIFTLYEGGGFGYNNPISDSHLKDIFSSKYFRKVIVTNTCTNNYLIENNFCPKEKIEFLFGLPVQFKKNMLDISRKRFYKKDKKTFDICFVAYRYDDIGKSKGYDLFIKAAKYLAAKRNKENADIRFHVIGNYDENIIDISSISKLVTFYGVKNADWLLNFYYIMDIVVAPVRANVFYEGSHDGYPMSPEQSLCGVAMFQSDEFNMNCDYSYYQKDEIVHIELDAYDIASKIEYYFNNLDELYNLAEKGRKKTEFLFDLEKEWRKIKHILLSNSKK